ncbi:MAG: hypothetical protein OXC82_08065 [Rhodobacteraceae bacterium]|nr:hypothetical protein [Paracoccaceae bacterium]MCY4250370.1 hypothetical protein [Paracoccaceae bacterium]
MNPPRALLDSRISHRVTFPPHSVGGMAHRRSWMKRLARSMQASPEDDVMSGPNPVTGEGNHKTGTRAKKG